MAKIPCHYDPCICMKSKPLKGRLFTIILLYAWQSEYDKRPYRHFRFRRLDFEERMNRKYNCIRDLRTIVNYLKQRKLRSASIGSIVVSLWDVTLLRDFARALIPLFKIELKLMHLPHEFFVMMRLNVHKMTLFELSLEGTKLTDIDIRMLREFLLACKTLRSLNVASCGISQYNFATLADGVHKSVSLRCVNSSNVLGVNLTYDWKMASLLGSLLMQNKLVELTLQHCQLDAYDMEPIAEYVSFETCTMRKLDFACNNIAADGARALMKAMATGKLLEYLDISCNGLGEHGGEWVAMYLSACVKLRQIHLTYNEIVPGSINLILLTLKKPVKLKKITLYGNMFDSETTRILRRLLESGVLNNDEIDISHTYDEGLRDYRIIPWR